jgi:4-hydroxy-4-methyl-2-oxoglutarate aldolase
MINELVKFTRKRQRRKHMPLTHPDLLELKRWNTPTVYNGWEQITNHNPASEGFNLEECRDFMPQMGPMVGYAVTCTIEPSNPHHKTSGVSSWDKFFEYIASQPSPKIVVIQDRDKPQVIGSFWGEVSANTHRALGCVGTITDGAIRDLDEMANAGFKALARRLCVGHAHVIPIQWNCNVEVFGRTIQPGQLIHADKHGFLAIPGEDENGLLEALRFMDSNECRTVIAASRAATGKSFHEILAELGSARSEFQKETQARFGRKGEL